MQRRKGSMAKATVRKAGTPPPPPPPPTLDPTETIELVKIIEEAPPRPPEPPAEAIYCCLVCGHEWQHSSSNTLRCPECRK